MSHMQDKILRIFKKADDYPFITVTVDMLETGIDVPEITNLFLPRKFIAGLNLSRC